MQNELIEKINGLLENKEFIIVAIDGRCGSGKTTLAERLKNYFNCNVIHMDDFFLRREQRNEERLSIPGENVDHERFLEEVLKPISKNGECSYRPFNCKDMQLGDVTTIKKCHVTIIEGSYTCHDKLYGYYDLRVFCDVNKAEQLKRLKMREGEEKLKVFCEKWIPLEEVYFDKFNIKEKCEIVINMN